MKEDAVTFAPAEPTGNGTPIPYLVNPQSDTTPPTYARQTAKCAIGFNRSTDYWGDDAALQQRPPRLTATECRRCTFLHADGQRTAASSEASSHTFTARPAGFEKDEVLRQRALDTIRNEAAAEEKGPEKKGGDGEEHMDEGDMQEPGQDKGLTGGEDEAGGSGTTG